MQEKPEPWKGKSDGPSGPMRKERGGTGEQRHSAHWHPHAFSPSCFNSGSNGALGISRLPFPRHNTRVGCRLLTFTLQLWASVWDGSRCLEVVAGGRQKDELGQHCSLPTTWAWQPGTQKLQRSVVGAKNSQCTETWRQTSSTTTSIVGSYVTPKGQTELFTTQQTIQGHIPNCSRGYHR